MKRKQLKSDVLTTRQERFVVEYATIGNGRQAAINAGYSEKIAAVMSCRLLKNSLVVAALTKIKKKDERKLEITRETVLMELAKGLFRDPIGMENAEGFVVMSLKDIPPELRSIIDGFEVTQQLDEDGTPYSQKIKVKLVPKASVIDMGMKHLGAYAAEKSVTKVSLDWDSMHDRSPIIDPAETEIKKIEGV
jgi:phage terminase small subunit